MFLFLTHESLPAPAVCHAGVIQDTLRPEPAPEHGAGVLWAGDPQAGIVHPPSELAVPVLPHRVDQVGADRKVLAVLDTAVQQAHLIVDQPVATTETEDPFVKLFGDS